MSNIDKHDNVRYDYGRSSWKGGLPLTSFVLRVIAMIAMFVDHAGLGLFPAVGAFRCVGRLSFPLYCFLLTQGFIHTKDVRAYARRLLLLAILSEIPFDLFIFGRMVSPIEQNALFSLLLGLLALCTADALKGKPLQASLVLITLCMVAMVARVSYGWLGVALCLAVYYAGKDKARLALFTLGALLLYSLSLALSGVARSWVLVSLCAAFAVVPMLLYNGHRGVRSPLMTALFYGAYPLHLIALIAIRAMRIIPPYFLG